MLLNILKMLHLKYNDVKFECLINEVKTDIVK
jgi:hypothetical protein